APRRRSMAARTGSGRPGLFFGWSMATSFCFEKRWRSGQVPRGSASRPSPVHAREPGNRGHPPRSTPKSFASCGLIRPTRHRGSMPQPNEPDLTALLRDASEGDQNALDRLMPLVYGELRKIAASYLRQERKDHTLQPTALVHEAYLRLTHQKDVAWQNRAHFF